MGVCLYMIFKPSFVTSTSSAARICILFASDRQNTSDCDVSGNSSITSAQSDLNLFFIFYQYFLLLFQGFAVFSSLQFRPETTDLFDLEKLYLRCLQEKENQSSNPIQDFF